jgi:hypothetical protein
MRATCLLVCVGCGLLGQPVGNGGRNLPISPAGPYAELQADTSTPINEPFVISELAVNLSDPSPLADGDGYRVWYTRATKTGPSEIWVASWASKTEPASGATKVFGADQAWEGANVSAPCVRPDGSDLVMFYAGDGGVGRARSTDGGKSWKKDAAPLLTGAVDPSAAEVDGTWFLYYTKAGVGNEGIFVATSTDGTTFTPVDTPVLLPRSTTVGTFDRVSVGQPEAVGSWLADEPQVGLLYTGVDVDGLASIGYAGSHDGLTFERFNGGAKPVLSPGQPSEASPGVAYGIDHSLLLFQETKANVNAIAAATAP